MTDRLLAAYVWQVSVRTRIWNRVVRDETGEGVISSAIAVLIMAFLGVAMWVGFRATLGEAQGNVDQQVDQIGR